MGFGRLRDVFIVKKTSAIMGLPGERTADLNVDHRGVCKFDSDMEPNYVTLKNAFVETLDIMRGKYRSRSFHTIIESDALGKLSQRDELRDQRKRLKGVLSMTNVVRGNVPELEHETLIGSCEWLIKRHDFQQWRDLKTSQVFWLNGNPATGKSFLTGFVLEHLKDLGRECSFYSSREGDGTRPTLSKCLLSLAYNMALVNGITQQLFLDMDANNIHFDKENYKSIWRQLFVGGILQLDFGSPCYWVVDALDECKDASDFGPLVHKINELSSIRVFISSRPSLELQVISNSFDPQRKYITFYLKIL
ncbi:MAG: hypothetical protein Q9181_002591 [Wetmoreana brouardii]